MDTPIAPCSSTRWACSPRRPPLTSCARRRSSDSTCHWRSISTTTSAWVPPTRWSGSRAVPTSPTQPCAVWARDLAVRRQRKWAAAAVVALHGIDTGVMCERLFDSASWEWTSSGFECPRTKPSAARLYAGGVRHRRLAPEKVPGRLGNPRSSPCTGTSWASNRRGWSSARAAVGTRSCNWLEKIGRTATKEQMTEMMFLVKDEAMGEKRLLTEGEFVVARWRLARPEGARPGTARRQHAHGMTATERHEETYVLRQRRRPRPDHRQDGRHHRLRQPGTRSRPEPARERRERDRQRPARHAQRGARREGRLRGAHRSRGHQARRRRHDAGAGRTCRRASTRATSRPT